MMIHSSSTNLFSGVETVRFNTLKFFPDQPDEMGWWPEGVVGPSAGGWRISGLKNGKGK